jgi:hypothetical protein
MIRVLLLLALAPAAVAAPPVAYQDGRLTARLDGEDLTEVLGEVARQAGLEVRGTPTDPQPLRLQLDAVPLADALPRLLAGQSFLVTWGGGRIKGVRLLGGAHPTTLLATGESPASAPIEEGETGSLAASHRPVVIGGRLARAVGAEETNFSEIMGVAMQNPDPRVRADALRVGLRIVDAEPELRSDLLQALDGLDDAHVAAWLTKVAGSYAGEVARRAARTSRSGSLRLRAEAVERVLRTTSAGG